MRAVCSKIRISHKMHDIWCKIFMLFRVPHGNGFEGVVSASTCRAAKSGHPVAVVKQIENDRIWREFRISVARAGMDHEKISGRDFFSAAFMHVLEFSGGDYDKLRKLMVVHLHKKVVRGIVHLAHDARQRAVLEIDV